ncbi:ATP phosphoribosyltransferase regulatory subunit [Anaerosolibacter sp.]|uniref:ATP phosphoribosyltransferase regulatory subunit n=1 Tax=Anaerosolibacter sp. TaxID=1872527 RepID=UPI0039EE984A
MENSFDFIPEGVMDIHSDEYAAKEKIIDRIKKSFKGYGYHQVSTPAFEYYDTFTALGGLSKEKMFKLIDQKGRILVLRPDMTIPIARMAAGKSGYQKYSYVSSIFRMNDKQNGMKREFIQAGVEFLGNEKEDADGEIIAIAMEILLKNEISDFQIDMGHVGFCKALLNECEISKGQQTQIQYLIEQKNLAELKDYIKACKIKNTTAKAILEIPSLYGSADKVIERASSLIQNDEMKKAIENLEKVYTILKDYGYDKYITIDLGVINPMHYYTGIVFKGYIHDYGKTILSGGRYDQLIKADGRGLPAVGFGLNVDKLMEVLEMYNLNDKPCYTDFLVLYKEENRKSAFRMASDLREKGFIVETDGCKESLKEQIFHAAARNIKEIIEIKGNMLKVISIKNNHVYGGAIDEFMKRIEMGQLFGSIH